MNKDERRYREAEAKLWAHAGVEPTERRVRLPRTNIAIRVQEVGDGPPILFVHPGGPNAGATWALVAARLSRWRCLMIDRPGAGLSDALLLDAEEVKAFADGFVAEILDALDIRRANLVSGSVGGYLGLRSAAAHPSRIGRMVQLGCPPMIPGGKTPWVTRVIMLPGMWRVLSAFPTEGALRRLYRTIGHGSTLDAGRIPAPFWAWQLALQRHTDQTRRDFAQTAAVGSFRRGFDRSLVLDRDSLRNIQTPIHLLAAPDDPFGDREVVEALTATLANAESEFVAGVGHWPWIDVPDQAASAIQHFFAAQDHTWHGVSG
jgi:2-hydroxy-6-oxonona-2,4-dienedioate hydrolase